MKGQSTTANDVTGALALAAAVVLIGLAAWIPSRHRGEGAAGPVRRWAIRVLVVPAFLVAVSLRLHAGRHGDRGHPLAAAADRQPAERRATRTSASRPPTASTSRAGTARRRNGASVLLISGGGGNRRSTLRHAKMLVRHGYGVLALRPPRLRQQRGHRNSYGWGSGEGRRRRARLHRQARRRRARPRRRPRALDRRRHGDRHRRPSPTSRPWSPTARTRRPPGQQGVHRRRGPARGTLGDVQGGSRSSRARSGPRASLADQSPAATAPHLIISAGKLGKESGRALRPGRRRRTPSSGTCRRPATPPRCGSTRRPASSAWHPSSTGLFEGSYRHTVRLGSILARGRRRLRSSALLTVARSWALAGATPDAPIRPAAAATTTPTGGRTPRLDRRERRTGQGPADRARLTLKLDGFPVGWRIRQPVRSSGL